MKINLLTRVNLVALFFLLFSGLIILQLVRFQLSPTYQKVSRLADEQYTYQKELVYPQRGNIYDRYGRLLAGNEEVYEVGVLLQFVMNPQSIVDILKDLPDVNYDQLLTSVSLPYKEGKSEYAVLANFVPANVIEILGEIKRDYELENPNGQDPSKPSLRGLVWYPQYKRSYPENLLASNVIGIYFFKQLQAAAGHYGVEEYYNRTLAGAPEKVVMPLDPYLIKEVPKLPVGSSIILTIDREIQAMVEKKLEEAIKTSEAETGTVIILDPRTGEVLAMASQPRLNPNMYWIYEEELNPDSTFPYNRAISASYEPGSVFKPITMAAAIDSGKIKPDDIFNDPGVFRYGGIVIYNWDRRAYGEQSMTECLQHSLNVCLSWVSTQLGAEDFYRYLQAFGFGRRTNIDLGNESSYPLYTPSDIGKWWDSNLVTNSFGQGISVTPIQIASALTALANDGKIMKPHVLKAILDDGQQIEVAPQVLSVPISAETANTLTEMLANSLEKEASRSLVNGYRVAGKTGTGEIPTDTGYSSEQTNASFAGWGPVDDPRFLVYVWLEKPKSSPWGSVVAAPLFRDIVQELVILMDLPPDDVRLNLIAQAFSNDNS